MPFLLFLKRIPWQAWAALAALIFIIWLRSHWIGVGYDKCMEANRKAQEAAAIEAKKQEEAAPAIAQEAQEAVKPVIEERVIYVNKNNTVSCDEPYSDGVQSKIREAEAAIDRLRSAGNPKDGQADN